MVDKSNFQDRNKDKNKIVPIALLLILNSRYETISWSYKAQVYQYNGDLTQSFNNILKDFKEFKEDN